MAKIGLSFVGLIAFWMLVSRRPHTAYQEVNGELFPVSIPNQMMPPQQQYGGYQQNYQGYPQSGYGQGQGYGVYSQDFSGQGGYQQGGYQQSSSNQGYNSPYNYNPGNFARPGGSLQNHSNYGNTGYTQSNYSSNPNQWSWLFYHHTYWASFIKTVHNQSLALIKLLWEVYPVFSFYAIRFDVAVPQFLGFIWDFQRLYAWGSIDKNIRL